MTENLNEEPALPLSSALFAALPSWSRPKDNQVPPFLRESSPKNPVNDETRKLAITIAAAIFAAKALTDWAGQRSPRFVAAVFDSVQKAKFLASILEAKD